MNQFDFFQMLCCPACRGGLEHRTEDRLYCPACKFTFPIVEDIPVLFPCDVITQMANLFTRYWDSEEKAEIYDTKVEGDGEISQIFGIYNHRAEVWALAQQYDNSKLDVILDAGCGNGRFFETFPDSSTKIGIDASLQLLRRVKKRGRGNFLVCGELEHLPFKDDLFDTVISCRVLQHLERQEKAVREMVRVLQPSGDLVLELYNTWNLKTVYKYIRMSPRLRRIFNAPFRLLFKSMSPFGDWGLEYDAYCNWFQVKRWMRNAGCKGISGRGAGFGYHKYFLEPFYVNAVMTKYVPNFARRFYAACFALEKAIGGIRPIRWTMEKIIMKGTKVSECD